MYNISLGSDKKADLDPVSKSPLWSRTPPGDKENVPHSQNLQQTPSPLKPLAARGAPEYANSLFKKAFQGSTPSPRRALQPLSSSPLKPPAPPQIEQIALLRAVPAGAVEPPLAALAGSAKMEKVQAEAAAAEDASCPASRELAKPVAPSSMAAAAPAAQVEIALPELAGTEDNKEHQARKIQKLQAEQRGADAKIMLLKFQMSRIKKREQAAAEPEPVVEAQPVAATVEQEVPEGPAVSEHVDLADARERESFLLHHAKLAAVLLSLAAGSAEAARSAGARSPKEVSDMGLQCSLLVDPLPSQEEGALRTELAVMERFVQRLKLQLRANIEAEINMHESISRGEVAARSCVSIDHACVGVEISSCPAVLAVEDDAVGAGNASAIFSGDEDDGDGSSRQAEDSVLSHADRHMDMYSPDSSINPLQSLAVHYASPVPPADNIIQSLAANYASPAPYADSACEESGDSEVSSDVKDEANDSTLADILETIERLPARECVQTPQEKEKPVQEREEATAMPRSHVKQAWSAWVINEPKPADMGLSPASFKDHIHRLRGANTLMRDDISRFRETLKRLTQY